MLEVLDALKVADNVLFLVSSTGIDDTGELLLTASLAQGLPSTTTAIVDISTIPIKVSRSLLKLNLQAFLYQMSKRLLPWVFTGEKDVLMATLAYGSMVLKARCSVYTFLTRNG